MGRFFLATGALAMAVAVALGAFSAHAAKDAIHPEAARLLQTAVVYQLVHGIGILLAGVLARFSISAWLIAAGLLHVAGIVLFCGALWMLAFTGRSLGPVAPLGGIAFMVGWIALAVHAAVDRAPSKSR
jgi:uncharacterized membrane protein YgdD (TMEM256/DUF423 family)